MCDVTLMWLVLLVRRFQTGDAAARDELCNRLAPGLLSMIQYRSGLRNRHDAEDVLQNTLIVLRKCILTGELHDPNAVVKYACTIGRRLAAKHIAGRQRRRENAFDASVSENVTRDAFICCGYRFDPIELRLIVDQLLNRMRARERDVFMADTMGESKEAICLKWHLTPQQFARILCQARKKFRRAFLLTRTDTAA